MEQPHLDRAVRRIAEGLREDPRKEDVGGVVGPRDFLFTERVAAWIKRLNPNPSEALILGAWGHTLYRWRLPRETSPMTTVGYHKWRNAQSALSAEEVQKILKEEGYDETTQRRVRELILKTNFPQDPDSQVLEDADCLAFLELKFANYLGEWDEVKTIRILKGTLEKMTPKAKELALQIALSVDARRLVEKALT